MSVAFGHQKTWSPPWRVAGTTHRLFSTDQTYKVKGNTPFCPCAADAQDRGPSFPQPQKCTFTCTESAIQPSHPCSQCTPSTVQRPLPHSPPPCPPSPSPQSNPTNPHTPLPPPPLCKHQESQENHGQTGSRCLHAMRGTKRTYVTENLPTPDPKHNCLNRALEHNVQHFSASSGGPHCPSGASEAVE